MKNRIADYMPEALRSPKGKAAGLQMPDVASFIKPANEFVTRHPGPCLAAAFTVGVIVAWWIKRR